jgi:hypothetical protein
MLQYYFIPTIPKKRCYFNVNKPIKTIKVLEKSSVFISYAGGKVELQFIKKIKLS